MHPVESSVIAAVGYDEHTGELYVQFVESGLYVYEGVERFFFEGLRRAESPGGYFNQVIVPRDYPFEQRG